MFNFFGWKELILVLLIVLVIFGPKKLPQIGRSFGEMFTNFRKGVKSTDSQDENSKTASPDDTAKDGNKSDQE
ncbi:MAG: twin-arginine translocase TatA/TatE family subunit [Eubacteriales bacterium]|nr:MAG: twin-arginine translocase TatA/TatE family subunit [Firmicutes bacterium HGW-Firmicutes-8]